MSDGSAIAVRDGEGEGVGAGFALSEMAVKVKESVPKDSVVPLVVPPIERVSISTSAAERVEVSGEAMEAEVTEARVGASSGGGRIE